MSITILKPGIHSSIQDLGRWGFQQFGIPISGVMDEFSAKLANIICGNDEHESVLELTLHGAELMFNEPVCVSITGGGCKVFINDIESAYNKLIKIDSFSILKCKPTPTGCRTYLAVQGGFDIKKEMGSVSTYTPASIGGINGQQLRTGDMILLCRKKPLHEKASELRITENGFSVSTWKVSTPASQILHDRIRINLCTGPEWELFKPDSQHVLFNSIYTISMKANRMGFHLEGNKLEMKEKKEMISTPVTKGIIQVTNEGLPIILMADAQTTGGYPRIARVCSADISALAQCRPGDKITFKEISASESTSLSLAKRSLLKQIKNTLNQIN